MTIPVDALRADVRRQLERRQARQSTFDVIVVGVGSMGSSACYHLARSGASVLGLEQFDLAHDRGSHGGRSRLIRKAYFEQPDYVPLLERAYQNWRSIERESGIQIYYPTGLLYCGTAGDRLMDGVQKSSEAYGIEVDEWSGQKLNHRFPQFSIPAQYQNLFEPDAGFVLTEEAILAHTKEAIKHGATIRTKEKVLHWKQEKEFISVTTGGQAAYYCKRLVLTAGAWTGQLAPAQRPYLQVTRQVLAWANPKQELDFRLDNFPCWAMTVPGKEGIFYGFPLLPPDKFGGTGGLKLAHHYRGVSANPDEEPAPSSSVEEGVLVDFLRTYLPDGYGSLQLTKTCFYTNTPDEHFIIDFLPENARVVIAAGFSGHGFKFVSAVGEVLADLVVKGKTDLPIGFLRAGRFEAGD